MGFKMKGFSGFRNDDEGKPPGPTQPPSKVDADPHGVHDNSPHNVAARETEGTIEEQAENLKNAIKSGHTRLVNPSATPKKVKHKNLEKVVDELKGAVKAHSRQAKTIDKHIDDMAGMPKKVSWKYGDGTYSGDLIPSMETSTHRYARTHNGKIKSLPKNK